MHKDLYVVTSFTCKALRYLQRSHSRYIKLFKYNENKNWKLHEDTWALNKTKESRNMWERTWKKNRIRRILRREESRQEREIDSQRFRDGCERSLDESTGGIYIWHHRLDPSVFTQSFPFVSMLKNTIYLDNSKIYYVALIYLME